MTMPNYEEKEMKCNKCGVLLGSFVITLRKHEFPPLMKLVNGSYQPVENPIKLPVKYKVLCTCGGESFIFKTDFKCFFLPTDEKSYDNMTQNGNLFTVKVK